MQFRLPFNIKEKKIEKQNGKCMLFVFVNFMVHSAQYHIHIVCQNFVQVVSNLKQTNYYVRQS